MIYDCIFFVCLKRMHIRASIDIESDSTLYTTYSFAMACTDKRQHHLRLSKYFQCHCDRCSDSSELGTEYSSLVCQACNGVGLIRQSIGKLKTTLSQNKDILLT